MRSCFLSILIFACSFVVAQRPYIFPSTVSPQPASQTDFINIYTKFVTIILTGKISESFTVNVSAKTVDLDLCYWSSPGASVETHEDTFALGPLAPGIYTANLTVYLSGSLNHSVCIPDSTSSASFTFEVVDVIIGMQEESLGLGYIKIGSNPVNDFLRIDSQNSVQSIKKIILTDIFGSVINEIYQPPQESEINMEGYSKGVYFLLIQGDKGRKLLKVIKE